MRWSEAPAAAALLVLGACAGGGEGPPVRVTVPAGSGLAAVTDSLAARGVVGQADLFRLYARFRDADRSLKPGVYEFRRGEGWATVVDRLVAGDVLTFTVTLPEGWTVARITARLAPLTGVSADSIQRLATAADAAERFGVPGPTLEGYLYPATYRFPVGTPPEPILRAMVRRYQEAWTPAMRARADTLGLSEREVVTLASIIEGEARVWDERPTISAVYHNRLRRGMRLQADPTVQYALGNRRQRLLYRDIDSVAANPYNTYTHAGLPPGPIGSPSREALLAALQPAVADYLYFVACPDGTHVFTRTLAEHNAAKSAIRRGAAR